MAGAALFGGAGMIGCRGAVQHCCRRLARPCGGACRPVRCFAGSTGSAGAAWYGGGGSPQGGFDTWHGQSDSASSSFHAESVGGRPAADATIARGLYFTPTHEWFLVDAHGIGTVGITQVAQRALGEVVFCRLPREGEEYAVMDTVATLEALKTVGEVKSPVRGTVVEVNTRLQREPGLVTHAPLTDGWLFRMEFRRLPAYLLRRRSVAREELEPILADPDALMAFLRRKLLEFDDAGRDDGGARELRIEGLFARERVRLHEAALELGLLTSSHGRGASRHMIVQRPGDFDPDLASKPSAEVLRREAGASSASEPEEALFDDDDDGDAADSERSSSSDRGSGRRWRISRRRAAADR
eukprot:TRINITY_DN25515_c0_g1_i1.p1 TRINITY_DN25515_c0_g1~~TRINITY_DN25515_c0_g1_i1.p1  ORF type:complete len:356 (-),score=76.64 TRINITY_DN25515_c0_g1_i1:60-1127(-)